MSKADRLPWYLKGLDRGNRCKALFCPKKWSQKG